MTAMRGRTSRAREARTCSTRRTGIPPATVSSTSPTCARAARPRAGRVGRGVRHLRPQQLARRRLALSLCVRGVQRPRHRRLRRFEPGEPGAGDDVPMVGRRHGELPHPQRPGAGEVPADRLLRGRLPRVRHLEPGQSRGGGEVRDLARSRRQRHVRQDDHRRITTAPGTSTFSCRPATSSCRT